MNFEYGDSTDAQGGCGAILMGEMWYFGGDTQGGDRTQVKQVCLPWMKFINLKKLR